MTASTPSDEETLDFSESDIPTPFKEKIFAGSAPATGVTSPAESSTSEPEQTPEPVVEPQEFEVATEVLADKDLSIFAEKAATAPEPVAAENVESEPEPTPEVVAELPAPSSEPAADLPVFVESKPAEPVAEIVPPAEAPIEAPITAPPEEPQVSIESVVEPAAIPVPVEEAPTVSETVEEVVVPAEQPAIAASATPTENKFLLNLNQCTVEDLAKIEGVGPILAQRIIEFRSASGGFKSPKELRHVPGINRKTLRTLTGPAPRTLNRLLGVEHNEELTLQEIVRLTSQLKGVAGCILAMSDGVFLTGQLPAHLDHETISVFAPQLFKKVGRYTKELRVGQITRLSVFTDQQPLSIFHAGDIFLVVIHDPSHFSKALLRRCERISEEIARLCRQRAVV